MILLTESFELVEADSALALRLLDAAGVENVVTFKEPHLRLVPLKVELHLAEVAPVLFVHHASTEVAAQNVEVLLHIIIEELLTN